MSKRKEGSTRDEDGNRLKGIKLFQDIMWRHRAKFRSMAIFVKLARDYKVRYASLMDRLRVNELREQQSSGFTPTGRGADGHSPSKRIKKLLQKPTRRFAGAALLQLSPSSRPKDTASELETDTLLAESLDHTNSFSGRGRDAAAGRLSNRVDRGTASHPHYGKDRSRQVASRLNDVAEEAVGNLAEYWEDYRSSDFSDESKLQ